MPTRKEVEETGHTVEDLALLARKLGYKSRFYQLDFGNGATASDLFDFFEDNPGAIEAVVEFVLENHPNVTDDIEDEEECDDEDGAEPDTRSQHRIDFVNNRGE